MKKQQVAIRVYKVELVCGMEMLGKSVEQRRFAREMPSQMLLEGITKETNEK